MDTDLALDFLAAHQPMPTDDVLDEDEIRQFDVVRRHFIAHPDVRCIPLFLRSVPKGSSGFGVYQLLDDVLSVHPDTFVIEALDEALTVEMPSHEWVLELSLRYFDRRLLAHARRYALQGDEGEREWGRTYVELHSSENR